ncbi:MAG: TIGR03915 family putative DNA repair protein [Tannerellaceae bacterium]|nr:TIGR03915 family putative DNA repair protein [Tannerellaceae bacterium]
MNIYIYDKTFEGLLTVVFDAYFRRVFPDMLCSETEVLPLFYNEVVNSYTNTEKSERVWNGLQKKISKPALSTLTMVWLSELPQVDMLLFRYIRKAIDAPRSIETNFGDPDVLEVTKIWKKVSGERHKIMQFLRFQKTVDDIYFAAMEPIYNVLPLVLDHLKDRFGGQKWLLYDLKRQYGYYYDLSTVEKVHFNSQEEHFISGFLSEELMEQDEELFQRMWKQYFKSIAIKERINPKLHRQHMPVRFWKYLTEKQQ